MPLGAALVHSPCRRARDRPGRLFGLRGPSGSDCASLRAFVRTSTVGYRGGHL